MGGWTDGTRSLWGHVTGPLMNLGEGRVQGQKLCCGWRFSHLLREQSVCEQKWRGLYLEKSNWTMSTRVCSADFLRSSVNTQSGRHQKTESSRARFAGGAEIPRKSLQLWVGLEKGTSWFVGQDEGSGKPKSPSWSCVLEGAALPSHRDARMSA